MSHHKGPAPSEIADAKRRPVPAPAPSPTLPECVCNTPTPLVHAIWCPVYDALKAMDDTPAPATAPPSEKCAKCEKGPLAACHSRYAMDFHEFRELPEQTPEIDLLHDINLRKVADEILRQVVCDCRNYRHHGVHWMPEGSGEGLSVAVNILRTLACQAATRAAHAPSAPAGTAERGK